MSSVWALILGIWFIGWLIKCAAEGFSNSSSELKVSIPPKHSQETSEDSKDSFLQNMLKKEPDPPTYQESRNIERAWDSIKRFEKTLSEYAYKSSMTPPYATRPRQWTLEDKMSENGITKELADEIIHFKDINGSVGLELIAGLSPSKPQLPSLPYINVSHQAELEKINKKIEELEAKRRSIVEQGLQVAEEDEKIKAKLKADFENKEHSAISKVLEISSAYYCLPSQFKSSVEFEFDLDAGILLCTVHTSDIKKLEIVKKRSDSYKAKWLPVSAAEGRKTREALLYAICIRTAYLAAKADSANLFHTIGVNLQQSWFDSATGVAKKGVIASLQVAKPDILLQDIQHIDAKNCFNHLKGISTPSIEDISPVRPILTLDKDDSRIIENKDVAASMNESSNLAAMPWEDFEHLVRQLFEWEFGRNGVEVKVTRASRDRGVDAIMYDPDPLRGGKFVLQAKRYTRTVDVAAVRDLYGTVVNEGANRGILVTTSSYGPDSYEFAKDKPISLIDGSNLVALLQKHGKNYRINLAEARAEEKLREKA